MCLSYPHPLKKQEVIAYKIMHLSETGKSVYSIIGRRSDVSCGFTYHFGKVYKARRAFGFSPETMGFHAYKELRPTQRLVRQSLAIERLVIVKVRLTNNIEEGSEDTNIRAYRAQCCEFLEIVE